MKKIVSILICIISCFFSFSSVIAEEFQLSDYSLQELLGLKNKIEQEIANRMNTENYAQIVTGYYEIGNDLPEGNYILTLVGSTNGGIAVFENLEDCMSFLKTYNTDLTKYSITAIQPTEQTHVKLEKNEVIFLYGDFFITKDLSYFDLF